MSFNAWMPFTNAFHKKFCILWELASAIACLSCNSQLATDKFLAFKPMFASSRVSLWHITDSAPGGKSQFICNAFAPYKIVAIPYKRHFDSKAIWRQLLDSIKLPVIERGGRRFSGYVCRWSWCCQKSADQTYCSYFSKGSVYYRQRF